MKQPQEIGSRIELRTPDQCLDGMWMWSALDQRWVILDNRRTMEQARYTVAVPDNPYGRMLQDVVARFFRNPDNARQYKLLHGDMVQEYDQLEFCLTEQDFQVPLQGQLYIGLAGEVCCSPEDLTVVYGPRVLLTGSTKRQLVITAPWEQASANWFPPDSLRVQRLNGLGQWKTVSGVSIDIREVKP